MLIDKKLTLSDLTPELLNKTAKDCAGIPLAIKLTDIKNSLDPQKFVESHKIMGGPAPLEVNRMLNNREQLTRNSKIIIKKQKNRIEKSGLQLKSLVQRYSTKKA
jgi:argininosuccinate lyase